MQRIISGLAVLLLAACGTTTPSAQETMGKVSQRFSGHKADDFFLSYGKPSGKTSAQDGTTYRWVSIGPPEMPPEPMSQTYAAPGGRHYGVAEPGYNMASQPIYCELQIQADKKDIIRKISIIYDSLGKYSNSFCSETLQMSLF